MTQSFKKLDQWQRITSVSPPFGESSTMVDLLRAFPPPPLHKKYGRPDQRPFPPPSQGEGGLFLYPRFPMFGQATIGIPLLFLSVSDKSFFLSETAADPPFPCDRERVLQDLLSFFRSYALPEAEKVLFPLKQVFFSTSRAYKGGNSPPMALLSETR